MAANSNMVPSLVPSVTSTANRASPLEMQLLFLQLQHLLLQDLDFLLEFFPQLTIHAFLFIHKRSLEDVRNDKVRQLRRQQDDDQSHIKYDACLVVVARQLEHVNRVHPLVPSVGTMPCQVDSGKLIKLRPDVHKQALLKLQ
eukprot:CAMPEP_0115472462 /NCGR_PEP_ID=MMETSP0271-20121206/53058_1 /TAXON_ID=71861 /ORGANISM="Scrippsiella trochoidea, Strain CCMP3099" /LENGTH=141 /DNA_ID=CAMNT_0002899693 /DNA_START=180 /DNA_END=605 /DNA_ORIENTATION=-